METAIKNSYKVGDGKTFLEPSALNALPSVVSDHRATRTSDRYEFINTMGVVNLLAHEGWMPVLAQEQRIRTLDRRGFQKHLVRFRQPDSVITLEGLSPEIILTNSHDGLNAYNLYAGFIRWICLNGLIVSSGLFASIRVKHLGHHADQIVEATHQISQEMPRLVDQVNTYQQITLEPMERQILAESALITRFAPSQSDEVILPAPNDDRMVINGRTFLLNQLLRPRREVEAAPTLWNTFNIVQEKIVQHGNNFENTVRTDDHGGIRIKRKVKGITAISENLRVNRGLWHLMDEMAKQKSSQTTV
jgi:hypothetical protein